MDELELLKKDWQKSDDSFVKKSSKELYAMLQKKSSTIVKTLFFISIAELIFWTLLNVLPAMASKEYRNRINEVFGSDSGFLILTIVSYVVILVFMYLLFKSHKAISVTDNAKRLMEKILHTRNVVKYYVICNLSLLFLSFVYTFYFALEHDPNLSAQLKINANSEMTSLITKFAVAIAVVLVVFWFFYKLIYGILIKRLNSNYSELQKLEN